jgi:hypothetical protein
VSVPPGHLNVGLIVVIVVVVVVIGLGVSGVVVVVTVVAQFPHIAGQILRRIAYLNVCSCTCTCTYTWGSVKGKQSATLLCMLFLKCPEIHQILRSLQA